MDEYTRKERLEQILISYSNTMAERQTIIDMRGHSSVKDYVLALADGLKYGNWPWTTYKDTTRSLLNNPIDNMHYIGCPAYGGAFGTCTCSRMSRE